MTLVEFMLICQWIAIAIMWAGVAVLFFRMKRGPRGYNGPPGAVGSPGETGETYVYFVGSDPEKQRFIDTMMEGGVKLRETK